jgi:alpha-L-rhamnosidase
MTEPSDDAEGAATGSGRRPVDLRVEFEREPNNVPPEAPRFAWRIGPTEWSRGDRQTAYRVLVSRSRSTLEAGEGDAWDSGEVLSSRSHGIVYDGAVLAADTTYYWIVRVWDGNGERTVALHDRPRRQGRLGAAGRSP